MNDSSNIQTVIMIKITILDEDDVQDNTSKSNNNEKNITMLPANIIILFIIMTVLRIIDNSQC